MLPTTWHVAELLRRRSHPRRVRQGCFTVTPGKGHLGTFAPRLDGAGNSVFGQLVLRRSPATSVQSLRLAVGALTGWPAKPFSSFSPSARCLRRRSRTQTLATNRHSPSVTRP